MSNGARTGEKPIVLLVGKLPGVIGDIARQLSDMDVEWLGAHDHGEVADGVVAREQPDGSHIGITLAVL